MMNTGSAVYAATASVTTVVPTMDARRTGTALMALGLQVNPIQLLTLRQHADPRGMGLLTEAAFMRLVDEALLMTMATGAGCLLGSIAEGRIAAAIKVSDFGLILGWGFIPLGRGGGAV